MLRPTLRLHVTFASGDSESIENVEGNNGADTIGPVHAVRMNRDNELLIVTELDNGAEFDNCINGWIDFQVFAV